MSLGTLIVMSTVGTVAAAGWGIRALSERRALSRIKDVTDRGVVRQMLVDRGAELKAQALKNYWDALGILGAHKGTIYFSTEVHFSQHKARIIQWYPDYLDNLMQRTLNSVFKAAELKAIEDPLKNMSLEGAMLANMELGNHYIFNLEMIQGERMPGDPMGNIIAAGTNLRPGNELYLQIITRPAPYRINNIGRYYLGNYKKSNAVPIKLTGAWRTVSRTLGPMWIISNAIYTLGTRNITVDTWRQSSDSRKMEIKLSSGTLFDTTIRILATGPDANRNLDALIAALATVGDKNSLEARIIKKPRPAALVDFITRRIEPAYNENYLSSPELAYFVHFPGKEVPYVHRLSSKKLPVPDSINTYASHDGAYRSGHIPFGYSTFRGTTAWLAFEDIKMLRQHAYVIGGTGSGKSTLLIALAVAILRHGGLTFFDVKGTTLHRLMSYISPVDRRRIIYVDLSSDEFFIPMNIMKSSLPPYDLANLIVDIFISVFGDKQIMARSQKVLRQSVLAVCTTDPDGTLMEVYRMFTDKSYRADRLNALSGLSRQGRYTEVYEYWRRLHNARKAAYDDPDAQAIINKLEKIMQSTRPRMMLSQKDNVLDWGRFMDEKAIVLINLDIGDNTPEIQRLFSTMLMTMIRQATFKRLKDGRHENDRPTHVTILDEFEVFAKDPEEFERLLAMARECGNGLILTHQAKSQLPQQIFDIIEDNTFSQIALNIGDASAPVISKMFPGFSPSDLTSFSCNPQDGLEGVCRMKKLSPEAFTFYVPQYWKLFKDYGGVKEVINALHQRDHVHISQCSANVEARYMAAEGGSGGEEDNQVWTGGAFGSSSAFPGAIDFEDPDGP